MKKTKYILVGLLVGVVLLAGYQVYASMTPELVPVSDGFYRQWVPKSGTNHTSMVDEAACNSTTDYVYTHTVGARDSYKVNISSIPQGATITQIDIRPCASNNKSGASSTLNVFYRYNGVQSVDSGNYLLSGTRPRDLALTSFTGLSLTVASPSLMEVGAVLSTGTKGARLSRISTQVFYIP